MPQELVPVYLTTKANSSWAAVVELMKIPGVVAGTLSKRIHLSEWRFVARDVHHQPPVVFDANLRHVGHIPPAGPISYGGKPIPLWCRHHVTNSEEKEEKKKERTH